MSRERLHTASPYFPVIVLHKQGFHLLVSAFFTFRYFLFAIKAFNCRSKGKEMCPFGFFFAAVVIQLYFFFFNSPSLSLEWNSWCWRSSCIPPIDQNSRKKMKVSFSRENERARDDRRDIALMCSMSRFYLDYIRDCWWCWADAVVWCTLAFKDFFTHTERRPRPRRFPIQVFVAFFEAIFFLQH